MTYPIPSGTWFPNGLLGFSFDFCVSMRMIIAVNSGYAQERIMENTFDQQVSVTVKEKRMCIMHLILSQ